MSAFHSVSARNSLIKSLEVVFARFAGDIESSIRGRESTNGTLAPIQDGTI